METAELKTFERIYQSSVSWNIRNYFRNIAFVDTAIESPEFVTNLRSHIKWRLALIVRQRYNEIYQTECILRRSPSCDGPNHIVVKVRLAMRDSKGNYWTDITKDFCFYANTAISLRGWDIYDCMENTARSTCFLTGNITVFCSILQDIPLHFNPSDADEDLRSLSDDLKLFYMSRNLTDLDLKVHEKTFEVHRAILNARCRKIARILKRNTHIQKIDLTSDLSVPLIEGLIEYWYSGHMEKLPKSPCCCTSVGIRNMEQLELRPFVDPESQEMSTTFKVSNRYISWIIDDFQFCEDLKHLERNIVDVYKCEDLPWKLHIYPKGIGRNRNYFTLNIISEDCVPFSIGYLEVFLKDENGIMYFCAGKTGRINKPGIYVFTKFVTHEEFSFVSEILLNHNILRVGCRITYPTGYIGQDIRTILPVEDFPLRKPHPYINLANDMRRLLESEDSSDVSLKSGDKIFKVHSAILAARSRYFESLFNNREYEASKSDIILEDVEPDDLDRILKYVYYAEKIVLNSDLALKLYPVFNKYEITRLENVCSNYLLNNVSVLNVLHIMQLANKFYVAPLKRTARQFFQENWDQIQNLEVGFGL